jgi:hypothetical protein
MQLLATLTSALLKVATLMSEKIGKVILVGNLKRIVNCE